MNEQAQEMIDFIVRDIIRQPAFQVGADTPLISSGLIDSLGLVDLLQKLEDVTKLQIPAGKVSAKDLDTVNRMLATVQRVGRKKK